MKEAEPPKVALEDGWGKVRNCENRGIRLKSQGGFEPLDSWVVACLDSRNPRR